MEQLLSIKRIPIQVEVKVQRPELKLSEDYVPKQNTPSVQVSKGQNGSLCFKADPIRLDLSENRNYDAYIPSGNSGEGFTLTYQAVAKFADSGNQGAQSVQQSGEAARKFSAQRASRSIEAVLQSLPKSKHSPISYSDGKLSINYQVNNSDLDDLAKDAPKFEFIPGSIEVIIKQMPGLDIEYLGDPIYFPRSADPNYEPLVDVTV